MTLPVPSSAWHLAVTLGALSSMALLATPGPALEQQLVREAPVSVRLIDLTGDGLLDRLEQMADGSLHVSVNLGGRLFQPVVQELPSTPVADILVADLDEDGFSDVYLISSQDNVALVGDGTGHFTEATARLGLVDGGVGVRARFLDLDADGKSDLLLTNDSHDVIFWKLPGLGFERSADTPVRPAGSSAPSGSGAVGGWSVPGEPIDRGSASAPAEQGLARNPGTSGVGLRMAAGPVGVGTSAAPPVVALPPSLTSVLDARYVNDNMGEIDGADITDGVLSGADVSTAAGDVTHLGGNVGIGVPAPTAKLDVAGDAKFSSTVTTQTVRFDSNAAVGRSSLYNPGEVGLWTNGTRLKLSANGEGSYAMVVMPSGNIGIGDDNPAERFHLVNGRVRVDNAGQGFVHWGQSGLGTIANPDGGYFGTFSNHPLKFFTNNSGTAMTILTNGRVGIGTTAPQQLLHVDGVARVDVLEITGGADIVEGFDSSEDLEPGTVVVIDSSRPGELVASSEAYDSRVAGVVSGANGVRPGLELGQNGVLDGEVPVAMTGRVWVRASAENGAIRPGDRLTTAGLPGHAMRATDSMRAAGSVIGKAMTALEEGSGLVLVLVNLQ